MVCAKQYPSNLAPAEKLTLSDSHEYHTPRYGKGETCTAFLNFRTISTLPNTVFEDSSVAMASKLHGPTTNHSWSRG